MCRTFCIMLCNESVSIHVWTVSSVCIGDCGRGKQDCVNVYRLWSISRSIQRNITQVLHFELFHQGPQNNKNNIHLPTCISPSINPLIHPSTHQLSTYPPTHPSIHLSLGYLMLLKTLKCILNCLKCCPATAESRITFQRLPKTCGF